MRYGIALLLAATLALAACSYVAGAGGKHDSGGSQHEFQPAEH